MRQTCIFSGSSHPQLVNSICERLGQKPAQAALKKFSNGETSVEIKTSVRDQDVFIVQSGSGEINDNVMELLIMINACKGGSSKSITAVMPYFPYSRQSKKKSHRGAITARMLANLMHVAGVNHVITVDLHASQMQGFFKCPVDNLFAETILAKWVRLNLPEWRESVVVSKNPGGTKRVTSLADRLGLSFGIVTTDRRKTPVPQSLYNSVILESLGGDGLNDRRALEDEDAESQLGLSDQQHLPRYPHQALYTVGGRERGLSSPKEYDWAKHHLPHHANQNAHNPVLNNRPSMESLSHQARQGRSRATSRAGATPTSIPSRLRMVNGEAPSSPLAKSTRPDSSGDGVPTSGEESTSHPTQTPEQRSDTPPALARSNTAPGIVQPLPSSAPPYAVNEDGYEEPEGEDDTDELARDVITGRLIHGHIVDDDVPSPNLSMYSGYNGQRHSSEDEPPDHMTQSFLSMASSRRGVPSTTGGHGLGGTGDATASDEEEEDALQNPSIETTVTLVGNVRDKPVLIVDDMIDKAGSWIAAAETVVKRGGATKVICMATHGLFGGNSLRELDACDEIEAIVVTNAFPIPEEKRQGVKKLVVLDISGLIAEAIRRNHYGESINQLYFLME